MCVCVCVAVNVHLFSLGARLLLLHRHNEALLVASSCVSLRPSASLVFFASCRLPFVTFSVLCCVAVTSHSLTAWRVPVNRTQSYAQQWHAGALLSTFCWRLSFITYLHAQELAAGAPFFLREHFITHSFDR